MPSNPRGLLLADEDAIDGVRRFSGFEQDRAQEPDSSSVGGGIRRRVSDACQHQQSDNQAGQKSMFHRQTYIGADLITCGSRGGPSVCSCP